MLVRQFVLLADATTDDIVPDLACHHVLGGDRTIGQDAED
jgi:hypothetical protein